MTTEVIKRKTEFGKVDELEQEVIILKSKVKQIEETLKKMFVKEG